MQVASADGVPIAYEVAGAGDVGLVFVHGWCGNKRWWDAQRDAFAATHTVAQLDLAGHGDSGGARARWSIEAYAGDVIAVAGQVRCRRLVLVGHSMAGAIVLEAAPALDRVAAVVLIDTLKDLEQVTPPAQVEQMLGRYRDDYRATVEGVLPAYLFAPGTPAEVRARLTAEFLRVDGPRAAQLLEPLYRYDARAAAAKVAVPVRAINGDLHPTNVVANRRCLRDFTCTILPGVGHYPMLECPAAFDRALAATLAALAL
ncbi:MAG: alpha/beta hydrolase [Myxococcales bacterium]|nr:alpha/beta hydrolase [Myxococcales bacterium]